MWFLSQISCYHHFHQQQFLCPDIITNNLPKIFNWIEMSTLHRSCYNLNFFSFKELFYHFYCMTKNLIFIKMGTREWEVIKQGTINNINIHCSKYFAMYSNEWVKPVLENLPYTNRLPLSNLSDLHPPDTHLGSNLSIKLIIISNQIKLTFIAEKHSCPIFIDQAMNLLVKASLTFRFFLLTRGLTAGEYTRSPASCINNVTLFAKLLSFQIL